MAARVVRLGRFSVIESPIGVYEMTATESIGVGRVESNSAVSSRHPVKLVG